MKKLIISGLAALAIGLVGALNPRNQIEA